MHSVPLNFQTLQKVFLGVGCVGLIISCMMTYKFGSTMSWLHAVALCLVTIAAAFIFPARKLIQDMGFGGKGHALKAAGVFFVCLELFSHLGYTIGMREQSTQNATVQTAAYKNTQDALESEKTNLAFWREQLKTLQDQNAWSSTVAADGLRAQLDSANKRIADEAKRGGCKSKCLALMDAKAELENKIATAEKVDDLTNRIEATQRILDGKTETAVAAKSGFSAARAQTDFVSQLYLIVSGTEAEKALNPDATTLSVSSILIGFFIAVGATALPTTAFYVAFFGVKGKLPRQPEDEEDVWQRQAKRNDAKTALAAHASKAVVEAQSDSASQHKLVRNGDTYILQDNDKLEAFRRGIREAALNFTQPNATNA